MSKLTREDIIKFYELKSHYDITSPNIGVTGDRQRFNEIVFNAFHTLPVNNKVMYANDNKNKYTIIYNDDVEITYIHITDIWNLRSYKFKKFI